MWIGRLKILIVFLISCTLIAQTPTKIDNEGVVKLVKSGITEDMIISIIRQQPGAYLLGADDLVSLKSAGVSERIIGEMMAKQRSEPALPGAPSASLAASGGDQSAAVA
jgi:hypothetical protein